MKVGTGPIINLQLPMKPKAKYKLGHKAEQAVKRLMPAPAGGSNTEKVVEHVYMNATKVYKPKPKRKPKSQHTCHQRAKLDELARKGQWQKYAELACTLLEQQAASDIAAPTPREQRPYFKDLPPSSHQQAADHSAVKRLTLAGVDQVVDTTTAIVKRQRSMAISKGRAAAKAKRAKQAELDAIQSQPSIWNR